VSLQAEHGAACERAAFESHGRCSLTLVVLESFASQVMFHIWPSRAIVGKADGRYQRRVTLECARAIVGKCRRSVPRKGDAGLRTSKEGCLMRR
jgi:hypothetical protein